MTESHLTVATIAAYVDGTINGDARADADRHLAACSACRAELSEVADLVVDLPSARRGSWRVAVGALVAAAIVGILVGPPARTPATSSSAERNLRPAVATLEIVAPLNGGGTGTLRDGRIVWRAVEPKATYRVTVADTTGATRWTAETSDTAVAIPASVRLEAGARYYLYVDALRADGWTLQSGPRTFTTAP